MLLRSHSTCWKGTCLLPWHSSSYTCLYASIQVIHAHLSSIRRSDTLSSQDTVIDIHSCHHLAQAPFGFTATVPQRQLHSCLISVVFYRRGCWWWRRRLWGCIMVEDDGCFDSELLQHLGKIAISWPSRSCRVVLTPLTKVKEIRVLLPRAKLLLHALLGSLSKPICVYSTSSSFSVIDSLHLFDRYR